MMKDKKQIIKKKCMFLLENVEEKCIKVLVAVSFMKGVMDAIIMKIWYFILT